MTRRLGVLGGTFDPIHLGHLDAAEAAHRAMGLQEVLFVPAHDPPHRAVDPYASAFHRFAMAALALEAQPAYRLSDMELLRDGSSYTADTLGALHQRGWSPSQLFFILGADAFAEIATWHAYPAVLDAAHFVVIARPGVSLNTALARSPELRARTRSLHDDPVKSQSTGIYPVEADTRDVSSTVIRGRLAAGRPIDDLVPAAVMHYIAAHRLYVPEDDLHGTHKGN